MEKKWKWIFFLTGILCLCLVRMGRAEEWDLRTCLEIGLKQNPQILSGLKGIEQAEQRVKQNLASYYPQLYYESDYNRYLGNFALAGGGTRPVDYYVNYFGLSQNIYDFGRREYQVQYSREDLKTYQWDLKNTRLTLIDNIRVAYYGVLLAQRIVKVRQEDLERTREHLKQAQGFYQVGLKARIDVTQAEVQVITAQKALLLAENNVQLARVTLATAMGLPQPPVYSLKDDLETGRAVWEFENLKKEALEKDPVLNRLRAVIAYWEAQENWAKRQFLPTVVGVARYGYSGSNYPYTETFNMAVQFNFPFFSGFRDEAKLAETRAALSQARANEQAQILQVINNLQTQFLNYLLAEKQIEVTRESLRSAQENLDLASGRYKAGVGAMLDITDARGSYVQSESDHNQAFYDYITARYKVIRAIGREEL